MREMMLKKSKSVDSGPPVSPLYLRQFVGPFSEEEGLPLGLEVPPEALDAESVDCVKVIGYWV